MKKITKPVFNGVALVCDDNTMNLVLICEHLKQAGFEVIVTTNGSDAVDFVTKRAQSSVGDISETDNINYVKQFDIIFMDIHMPVMGGVEATERIREIDSRIPVIAVTTDVSFKDVKKYSKHGFIDYIGKPYRTDELWQCVLKYLKPEQL